MLAGFREAELRVPPPGLQLRPQALESDRG